MPNLLAQIALAAFFACSTQFLEGGARMNLGARMALWSGGKKMPTARDYITKSPCFMFDGLENDGYGVHSDSIPYLTDLISGERISPIVTMDITNSWGDDYLQRNGFTYYRFNNDNVISKVNSAITNRKISIELIVSEFDEQENLQAYTIGSSRTQSLFIGRLGNRYVTAFFTGGTRYDFSNMLDDGVNTHSIAFVHNGVTYSWYKNGVKLKSDQSNPFTEYSAITYMALFQSSDNKYHSIRINGDALSDAEIKTNWEIDKARFGLP